MFSQFDISPIRSWLNMHSTFASNQCNQNLIQDPLIWNSIPTDDSILLLLSFLSPRMSFSFNSNPCLSTPSKLNCRSPISKPFSFKPSWFSSDWVTGPLQSLGTLSGLCFAGVRLLLSFSTWVFSPQQGDKLLVRQGHIHALYIPSQNLPVLALVVNAQRMVRWVRQWGRRWLVYILDFVDSYTGLNFKCYWINFYLIWLML